MQLLQPTLILFLGTLIRFAAEVVPVAETFFTSK
jgi:hypothetical protein